MRKRLSLSAYADGIRSGNRVILSQAITLVESMLAADQELASQLVQEVLPLTGNSLRIGITGVPGVGKSTFIEAFGKLLLDQGKKVAVLAVDPSSQLTKGSILGDKTRMEALAADKRAFIRPSPSGHTLGGVSARTREAMLLCEAAGFDVILIETVGVGQSETAVKNMVDFFLLLMLAGAGDELQGIKKGIMEMADGLVIHKADGDNLDLANKAKTNYRNALHLFPQSGKNWSPKVILASSLTGLGLEKVWDLIKEYERKMKDSCFWETNRAEQRINWLEDQIQDLLGQAFLRNEKVSEYLQEGKPKVKSGELHPGVLAQQLINLFLTR
ncbi:methylmalonyl Co-A mutase-associated GTPase MeaB [Algoriphagus sp. AK58]|uniref:methylmalonyl Co-A mutase-associated GTPase MeaB n=1 Tax=Algoriphagus sp. AK58 TaxID=1406877 RepID=UPI0016504D43|nr:methylmalonyl Co-A mutase-associated GTPase MeaB [Algoriphagus sp. AK58]MBC6366962.1 methylmalonyl Co-A mutase-associated GTPase MeaB [Algoriphagus sp. AK58]